MTRKTEKFKRFDVADYLDDVAAYLEIALEASTEDPTAVPRALGVIARSQNMSEFARRVGMSRDGLQGALRRRQPNLVDHPQGHQRTRTALRAAHRRVRLRNSAGIPQEIRSRPKAPSSPDSQILRFRRSARVFRNCRGCPTPLPVFELYFDRRHPSKVFFRTPGGLLLAAFETAGKEDNAVKLRPTAGKPRLSGAHEPSAPDPAARPV